jgi:hypothetical protein
MILYAIAKFVAYSLWCLLGLQLFAARPSVQRAAKFGAVRWLLGLAFGVFAGISIGSVDPQSVTELYFGIYVPLRFVEWSIMVALLSSGLPGRRALVRGPRTWLWVLGGVVLSFATDLASPEGIEGRFCVGRCLC